MDGGFGTALGSDSEADVLWGAQHLFTSDGHARIEAVHRAFLDAGADIISTSSYQVSFEIFSTAGTFAQLPGGAIEDEKHQLRYTRDVLRTTVELAKKARHEHERAQGDSAGAARLRPLVAASVGPAGDNITLWSGATDPNTNDHGLPDAVVSQYYARKLGALALAKPDLVLLETLPSLREARLALAALDEAAPELPAIVAFICRSEELTAAGDVFAEACAEVAAHPRVAAVGLNCVAPDHVEGLLTNARARCPDAVLVAYPNSGEAWDARETHRCWTPHDDDAVLGGPDAVAMRRWGADVVGGCCRVTAAQIGEFRAALLDEGAGAA